MTDEELERIAWQGSEKDASWAHLANEARRARDAEEALARKLELAKGALKATGDFLEARFGNPHGHDWGDADAAEAGDAIDAALDELEREP